MNNSGIYAATGCGKISTMQSKRLNTGMVGSRLLREGFFFAFLVFTLAVSMLTID